MCTQVRAEAALGHEHAMPQCDDRLLCSGYEQHLGRAELLRDEYNLSLGGIIEGSGLGEVPRQCSCRSHHFHTPRSPICPVHCPTEALSN